MCERERLLSLVSQCCGELMLRQRPAAQANFYAITGIMAPFLFSHSLSLGLDEGGIEEGCGRYKCV